MSQAVARDPLYEALLAVDGGEPGGPPQDDPLVSALMDVEDPGAARRIVIPGMPGYTPDVVPASSPKPRSMAMDVLYGLSAGVPEIRRQVGGAVSAAGDLLPLLPEGARERIRQIGREEVWAADDMQRASGLPEPTTMPGRIAKSVPGFGALVAGGVMTGGAGFLAGAGLQSMGSEYNSAIDRGAAPETAAGEALTVGLWAAASSAVPMGLVLGRFAPQAVRTAVTKLAGDSRFVRLAGAVIAEGSQEASEEVVSMVAQRIIEEDPEAWNGALSRMTEAAIGGALLGGGAHAVVEAVGGHEGRAGAPPTRQIAPSPDGGRTPGSGEARIDPEGYARMMELIRGGGPAPQGKEPGSQRAFSGRSADAAEAPPAPSSAPEYDVPDPIMEFEDGSALFDSQAKADRYRQVWNLTRDRGDPAATITPLVGGAGWVVGVPSPGAHVDLAPRTPVDDIEQRRHEKALYRREKMRGSPGYRELASRRATADAIYRGTERKAQMRAPTLEEAPQAAPEVETTSPVPLEDELPQAAPERPGSLGVEAPEDVPNDEDPVIQALLSIPPADEAEAPAAPKPGAPTFEEWVEGVRFYRSGKSKNAQLPDGERVGLRDEATASNFRVTSEAFLRRLYNRRFPAASKPLEAPQAPVAPTVAPPPKSPPKSSAPAAPTPDRGVSAWREVGYNADGELVQENTDGVRSYVTKEGVRVTESVTMRPGRPGRPWIEIVVSPDDRDDAYKTVDELGAGKPTEQVHEVHDTTAQPELAAPGSVADLPRAPRTRGVVSEPAEAPPGPGAPPVSELPPARGGARGERGGADDAGRHRVPDGPRRVPEGHRVGGPGGRADDAPEGGGRGEAGRVPRVRGPAAADLHALNHRIEPSDSLAPSGYRAKVSGNIRAIRTLLKLEKDDRAATPEERKILAQYVGFGPISEVLNAVKAEVWERHLEREKEGRYSSVPDDVESWAKKNYEDYKAIRELVSRDELDTITRSTLNAHYTGADVIRSGIWGAVERLGFTGGNVLETSAGIGHMIGLIPDALGPESKWTAVEMDSISSRILQKLYPGAKILNTTFQEAPLRRGSFDLVVGNVPFNSGKIDTDEGYPRFSLHNYFLAKSIDMLKPGGLMVAISSISSMDAPVSQEWREWMAERATLVGAIRLPNTAFTQNANTSVTTDILIFKKKGGKPAAQNDFSYTVEKDTGEKLKGVRVDPIPLNVYYEKHPEMIAGTLSALGTMNPKRSASESETTVDPDKSSSLSDQITAAVKRIPSNIAEGAGDTQQETTEAAAGTKPYQVFEQDGAIYQLVPGEGAVKLPDQDMARAYVELREATNDLIASQTEDVPDEDLKRARDLTRTRYEAFVEKYGQINATRRGRLAESFAPFEEDGDFNRLSALEKVQEIPVKVGETKTGKPRYKFELDIQPADILTKRTQWHFAEPARAESWDDAVSISEFFRGRLDLPYVAKLMGAADEDAAKNALLTEGLAFIDPADGGLRSKEEYLSGNVKEKLKAAEKAAIKDPAFETNAESLRPLIPEDKPISKIKLRLGASWVPSKVYEDFAAHLFGPGSVAVQRRPDGLALVQTGWADAEHEANWRRYGTPDFSGPDLVAHILKNERPIAYDSYIKEDGSTGKRQNPERTADANAMMEQISEMFGEWVRTGDAAVSVADAFNDRLNATVERKHKIPKFEHLPGASQSVKLRPYQLRAVMRGVLGSYLNAHEVGMGKTFVAISTAMEWRRLGIARKPVIVVQPSTYQQFAASFNQLYPGANVLVPTAKMMRGENRKRLTNRIATGDYDAIIMPHTLFNQMSTSLAFARSFLQAEIDDLISAHADAVEDGGKTSPTAKRLEEQKKAIEKFLQGKIEDAKAGNELNIDELGIDGLIVDEAHQYKNSYFRTAYTNLKGVNSNAAERSLDMLLKTRYMQQKVGKNRNVVLMTGTPVSNTVGEAWVMMRYVRPDVLEANGISNFDDFATSFAETSTKEELDATNRYKPVTRMRAFQNVRQFQSIWLDVTDVVRWDQLSPEEQALVPRPEIKGGKPELIEIEPTKDVDRIYTGLIQEYEAFENMSPRERWRNKHIPGTIYTKARKAAVDPRLVDTRSADDPKSKVNTMIARAMEIYHRTADAKGAQVIFSDLYQDNANNPTFNIFEDIRRKLIAAGVPPDEVVIATDLSDAARKAVFSQVNEGQVRFILGTTEKLGVGVNIQRRLAALHHLEAPWVPKDIEQREGRIIRFGNYTLELTGQLPEILRYGVKRTFDASQYDRLARKQRAVNDTISGQATDDVVDIDEVEISFAEASAAFSGNPDMLRAVQLAQQVKSLEAIRGGVLDAIESARRKVSALPGEIQELEQNAERLEALARDVAPRFAADTHTWSGVGGEHRGTIKEIGKALDEWIKGTIERTEEKSLADRRHKQYQAAGTATINGVPIALRSDVARNSKGEVIESETGLSYSDPIGGYRSNPYRTIRGLLESIKDDFSRALTQAKNIRERIQIRQRALDASRKAIQDTKFERQAELDAAKAELEEVRARLRDVDAASKAVGHQPGGGPTPDTPPGNVRMRAGVADRALSWIDTQIARIKADMAGPNVLPRARGGSRSGATTLIPDVVNTAALVALKATKAGIEGGRALSKLVSDTITETAPHLEAFAAHIRRIARRILKAATSGGSFSEQAFAAALEDARDAAAPREVREATRQARRQDERAEQARNAAVRKAVRDAARAARSAGRAEARLEVEQLRQRVTDAARRLRAMSNFERRAAVEGAQDRASARAAEIKGLQDEAVRVAMDSLPAAVRGKILRTIKNARTLSGLRYALARMSQELAFYEGRRAAVKIGKWSGAKRLRLLDVDARREARADIAAGAAAWARVREEWKKGAIEGDPWPHVQDVRAAYASLRQRYADAANERAAYVNGHKVMLGAVREKLLDTLGTRKELPSTGTEQQQQPSALRRYARYALTPDVLAKLLDGDFYGGGPFVALVEALKTAHRRELALAQRFDDAADVIVKRNGYKSLGDWLARWSGTLGEQTRERVDASLGGVDKMGKGFAAYVAALDPATVLALGPRQRFNWSTARDSAPFELSPRQHARVVSALPDADRRIVRELKALYDRLFFDALDRVHHRMNGSHIEKVPGYWGIKRNLKQSEKAKEPRGWRSTMAPHLENAGMLQTRTGGRTPIVLGDFATEIVTRARSAAKIIAMAQAVRAIEMTWLHPDVRSAIAARFGTGPIVRMERTLDGIAGEPPSLDSLGRGISWLKQNVGAALTQGSWRTWLRQLSGIPRLALDLGHRRLQVGMRDVYKHKAKDLLAHSPYFRQRYSGGAYAPMLSFMAHDTAETVDLKSSLRALGRELAALSPSGADRAFRQARQALTIGNWFDMLPARVAFAAHMADTGGDVEEAARRTERTFQRTQNTGDQLNASGWAQDAAREPASWQSVFLMFFSDPNKMYNLLYEARHRGPAAFATAAAYTAFNTAWSSAVSMMSRRSTVALGLAIAGAALTGGDDEDRRLFRLSMDVLEDLAALDPALGAAVSVLRSLVDPSRQASVLDNPVSSTLGFVFQAVQDVAQALSKWDDRTRRGALEPAERLYRGLGRLLEGGSRVIGAPWAPLVGDARRVLETAQRAD